jgi:hypothetical protein
MMDDDQIAALAKGMVPFVRQCVAEAFGKAAVSPELAAQVASAVRLLHEAPPLAQRSEPPRPSPKVARIERDDDGNFVPVYDDQSV